MKKKDLVVKIDVHEVHALCILNIGLIFNKKWMWMNVIDRFVKMSDKLMESCLIIVCPLD